MNPTEKKKAKKLGKLMYIFTLVSITLIITTYIVTVLKIIPIIFGLILLFSFIVITLTLFFITINYIQTRKDYYKYIHKWRNYNAYLHCIELIKNYEYEKALHLSGCNVWMYPNLQHFIVGLICSKNPELFTRTINKTIEKYYQGEFKI